VEVLLSLDISISVMVAQSHTGETDSKSISGSVPTGRDADHNILDMERRTT
jgi:hypothetical protein